MSLSANFGACKRGYVMHSSTLLSSKEGDGRQRLLHESDVSSGNVKRQDLNIPLRFSRHWVNILAHLVVSLVPQHGPDNADNVSAKSTNSLVVGLALCTFSVVVSL